MSHSHHAEQTHPSFGNKHQAISELAARIAAGEHLNIDPLVHLTGLITGPEAAENKDLVRSRFTTQLKGFDAYVGFDDEINPIIELIEDDDPERPSYFNPSQFALASLIGRTVVISQMEDRVDFYTQVAAVITNTYPLITEDSSDPQHLTIYTFHFIDDSTLVTHNLAGFDIVRVLGTTVDGARRFAPLMEVLI